MLWLLWRAEQPLRPGPVQLCSRRRCRSQNLHLNSHELPNPVIHLHECSPESESLEEEDEDEAEVAASTGIAAPADVDADLDPEADWIFQSFHSPIIWSRDGLSKTASWSSTTSFAAFFTARAALSCACLVRKEYMSE
jgi:hypothetical protein